MHKSFEKAEAFSPAGISSFFEICDERADGTPIKDPTYIGSRGGGFVIEKGVYTKTSARHSSKNQIEITINGKDAPRAETTKFVIWEFLKRSKQNYEIKIEHRIDVPMASGYGSSGAGALSTALALDQILNIGLTYNEMGVIAHIAEIENKTGLGTVGPLMIGGCVLTTKSGAPGFNVIDRIALKPNYSIVSVYFGHILTKEVLVKQNLKSKINESGKKTLNSILKKPTIENFMNSSKKFAQEIGFLTDKSARAIRLLEKAGAIGATQNMIGDAVHCIVEEDYEDRIIDSIKEFGNKLIVSRIANTGARLL